MPRVSDHQSSLLVCLVTAVITSAPVSGQVLNWDDTLAENHPLGAYRYLLPPDYDASKAYPLVMYLPGLGGLHQWSAPGLLDASQRDQRASIVFAPENSLSPLYAVTMLQDFRHQFAVDPARIYLTGFSYGAFGTWELIADDPHRFAAAVPVGGSGANTNDANITAERTKHIPIWAFNGEFEGGTPRTQSWIETLVQAGGNPRLTIHPGEGHTEFPAYTDTNNELYPWLFRQVNPTPELIDETRRRPTSTYEIRDRDFDGRGDRFANAALRRQVDIGEVDSELTGQLTRLVTKFLLPNVSTEVRDARLRVFVERADGRPPSMSLFHSVSDNDLFTGEDSDDFLSDYEDGSYVDTLLPSIHFADEQQRFYDFDVTEFVQSDYGSDGEKKLSAFRFQISEATFVEDDQSNSFRLTMPGAHLNRPELILTVFSGCDVNRDGGCDVDDIDAMTHNVLTGVSSHSDRERLITRPHPDGFYTFPGDANLDGMFDTDDLIHVFAGGKYFTGELAGWAEGDFDGDRDFDPDDLIEALSGGGYNVGPREAIAAVPEPMSQVLLLIGLVAMVTIKRE